MAPADSPIVSVILGPEATGQRLDRALADSLPDHSRSEIARWIADGLVTLDGVQVPGRHRLKGGEQARVEVPPPRPATVEPEPIPLRILHEDDHILVVDKQEGLAVHPGSGRPGGTLANALVHHVRGLPELIGSDRPGIVHRLDMDTSGVMVVARTESAQRTLSAQFAARTVEKTYLACVHGRPEAEHGTVDLPIGRSPSNRKKMAVVERGGRVASTAWSVRERLPRHTLLTCRPKTGRTHQIRVHLVALGHPIVGDPIYANRSAPGEESAHRLMLHAWRLAFDHPDSGKRMEVEAEVPSSFDAVLDALRKLPPPRRRARTAPRSPSA